MRVLLSVVGTRGDVQPVIALALEVRKLGHDVRLCIPPNFIELAQVLGFAATPVGIEMRAPRAGETPRPIPDLIADQFDVISVAAKGCDVILGASAHQYAAPSAAEVHGIPYVNAVYAPTALPADANTRAWNERSLERVNANRARLGLAPIDDVLRYVLTDHPLLATDPALDPPPSVPDMNVTQTGAWILADANPLPADLETFLDAGEPPVYFGFGSMPVAEGTGRTLTDAARAIGRRAIVSQGWADLRPADSSADCLSIGDVNHHALFPRVAAVMHHGGAGTTHVSARSGVPQVVVPMFGDQPYWARRVCELGIGASVPMAALTTETLSSALHAAIATDIAQKAQSIATSIGTDGAATAARLI